MDISVLVPIYKVEKYVEKCLRSLFEQTKTDGVEFVLVNDCTPDNSMAIVRRVVAEYPNLTVKILEHDVNCGIAATRQTGLDAMTGDYTIQVDSDDWCEPTMLKELYETAIKNSADIVCCDLFRNSSSDETYVKYGMTSSNGVDCAEHLLRDKVRGYLYIKLIKLSLYRDNDISFTKGINMGEDLAISAKLFAVAKNVVYTSKAYYHYMHANSGSISNNLTAERLREVNEYALKDIEKYFEVRGINDDSLKSALIWRKIDARFNLMYYSERSKRSQFANLFPEVTEYIPDHQGINSAVKFGMLQAAKGQTWIFNLVLDLSKLKNNIVTKLKLRSIVNKLRRAIYVRKREIAYARFCRAGIEVDGAIDTIRHILTNRSSVSRYGDGEFNIMINDEGNGFQQYDPALAARLNEIINSNVDNHIVCIPHFFVDMSNVEKFASGFWRTFIYKNEKKLIATLTKKRYYDTQITRFYNDYVDKSQCQEQVELLKEIWLDRDLLIVEGDKSRSGVGNDLFAKAKSIRRILAPAENAFDKYDDILSAIKRYARKDDLVLLALGMTATVLAYDLAKDGFQAIDLGHLDIEYEWFMAKATKKSLVKNKYVNELWYMGGVTVAECTDEAYLSQIVDKIL